MIAMREGNRGMSPVFLSGGWYSSLNSLLYLRVIAGPPCLNQHPPLLGQPPWEWWNPKMGHPPVGLLKVSPSLDGNLSAKILSP
jgi:hypothetical protein